jgi:hypothetical protein
LLPWPRTASVKGHTQSAPEKPSADSVIPNLFSISIEATCTEHPNRRDANEHASFFFEREGLAVATEGRLLMARRWDVSGWKQFA